MRMLAMWWWGAGLVGWLWVGWGRNTCRKTSLIVRHHGSALTTPTHAHPSCQLGQGAACLCTLPHCSAMLTNHC